MKQKKGQATEKKLAQEQGKKGARPVLYYSPKVPGAAPQQAIHSEAPSPL